MQLNNVPVSYIDGGLSFLAKNNLQFDVYGGTRINKNTNEFFVGAGVSYRIPN
ncbi:MAG: transporter [Ignavibacteria bacterium]|nr:transporter [Ignavibacteria bacterium]